MTTALHLVLFFNDGSCLLRWTPCFSCRRSYRNFKHSHSWEKKLPSNSDQFPQSERKKTPVIDDDLDPVPGHVDRERHSLFFGWQSMGSSSKTVLDAFGCEGCLWIVWNLYEEPASLSFMAHTFSHLYMSILLIKLHRTLYTIHINSSIHSFFLQPSLEIPTLKNRSTMVAGKLKHP